MTEEHTEPIEDIIEAPEAILPIEAPAAATKSRKVRSELQLQALANARQKAYKVRADKAELKKVKNESKKTEEPTEEVSIELHESHKKITDDSKKDAKDDSEKNTENENTRYVKKEDAVEESHIDRIERHASRQEYNDYINNLIDERVKYKPIIKSKFKMVDGVYVIR
jgi:hypothetical protein